MVQIEHVAGGWEYTFGNGVSGTVAKILVCHDGLVTITYQDGSLIKVAP